MHDVVCSVQRRGREACSTTADVWQACPCTEASSTWNLPIPPWSDSQATLLRVSTSICNSGESAQRVQCLRRELCAAPRHLIYALSLCHAYTDADAVRWPAVKRRRMYFIQVQERELSHSGSNVAVVGHQASESTSSSASTAQSHASQQVLQSHAVNSVLFVNTWNTLCSYALSVLS